jgi:E3 ubiquitin-protein ligase MARCH6
MAQTTYKGARTLFRLVRILAEPIINICIEIVRDVVLNPMISSFRALERIAASRLHLPVPASSTQLSSKLDATFARIGRAYEAQRQISARIAGSSSIPDRVWCMVVGYAVVIFMVVVIAVAGEANLGRLSTGVADQLQQNSKFLKLAMFMALEMAMFPIIAGGAINFSLIPVFEGTTIESRLDQLRSAPFSSVFVCWVIGTR